MAIFTLLLFVGIGLCVFAVVLHRRGNARYVAATTRWEKTEARIDAASLRQVRETQQDDQRGGQNYSVTYQPVVAYSYRAGGSERHGTKPYLCRKMDFNSQKRADAWLATVPVGGTVPTWFDPANPDDAALELNAPSRAMLVVLFAVGIGLTLVSLVAVSAG